MNFIDGLMMTSQTHLSVYIAGISAAELWSEFGYEHGPIGIECRVRRGNPYYDALPMTNFQRATKDCHIVIPSSSIH